MGANVSKAVRVTYNLQTKLQDRSSLVIARPQTYHTQNNV